MSDNGNTLETSVKVVFKCKYCHVKFTTAEQLVFHKRTEHANIIPDPGRTAEELRYSLVTGAPIHNFTRLPQLALESYPVIISSQPSSLESEPLPVAEIFPRSKEQFMKLGSLKKHKDIPRGKTEYSSNVASGNDAAPSRYMESIRQNFKGNEFSLSGPILPTNVNENGRKDCRQENLNPPPPPLLHRRLNELQRGVKSEYDRGDQNGTAMEKFCRFCGKFFPYPGQLRIHVRSHTGERPYSCKYCQQTFTQIGSANVHMKKCSSNSINAQSPVASHLERDKVAISPAAAKSHAKVSRWQTGVHRAFSQLLEYRQGERGQYENKSFSIAGSAHLVLANSQNARVDHSFRCEHCRSRFTSEYNTLQHQRLCWQKFIKTRRNQDSINNINFSTVVPGTSTTDQARAPPVPRTNPQVRSSHNSGGPSISTAPHRNHSRGKSSKVQVGTHHVNKTVTHRQQQKIQSTVDYEEDGPPVLEPAVMPPARRKHCRFCGKKLTNHANLIIHERIHTGEKPFLCGVCSKAHNSPYSAKYHEQRCKLRKLNHSTSNLAHSTASRKNLSPGKSSNSHAGTPKVEKTDLQQRKTPNTVDPNEDNPPVLEPAVEPPLKRKQCRFCGKKITIRTNLIIHERIHTGEKPFLCGVCSKSHSSPYVAKSHEKKCKIRKFNHLVRLARATGKATTEGASESGEEPSTSKKFTETEEAALSDPQCDSMECVDGVAEEESKLLTEQVQYIPQLLRLLKDGKFVTYSCTICGKSLKNLHHARQCVVGHIGTNVYKCPSCDDTFPDRVQVVSHEKTHSAPFIIPSHSPRKRGRPGKIRPEADNLIMDTLVNGKSLFICNICGKKFPYKSFAQVHALAHLRRGESKENKLSDPPPLEAQPIPNEEIEPEMPEKDNLLKCNHCPLKFTDLQKWDRHEIGHGGKSCFLCLTCGQWFYLGHNLKKHMLNHEPSDSQNIMRLLGAG